MSKAKQLLVLRFDFMLDKVQSLYKAVNTVDFSIQSNLEKFKLRCSDLDTIKVDVEEAYISLSQPLEGDELLEHKNRYLKFEEQFIEVKLKLQSLVASVKSEVITPCLSTDFNVKLPRINLPTFRGNYCDFTNFINMFDNLVHQNQSLSLVQKKHYLLSCLTDEPLNLVKHLSNIPENYEVARRILIDRYDDKRMIADTHLNAMLSLPTVSARNITQLRTFVGNLQENTRGLTSLGFPVKEWSILLLHIFTRRLDNDIRSRFELAYQHVKIPTFDNLLTFLDTYCKTLETTGLGNQIVSGKSSSTLPTHKYKLSHTSSLEQESSDNTPATAVISRSQHTCPKCHNTHYLYKCDKFAAMSLDSRREFVKLNNLCFNCLRPHRVFNCNSRSSCKLCHRKHNTLLHTHTSNTSQVNAVQISQNPSTFDQNDKGSLTSSTTESNVAKTQPPQHLPETADIPTSSLSNTATAGKDARHCYSLLATAVIDVAVSRNGRTQSVRALLDPGSMTNFITRSCAHRLGARFTNTNVTITGIGGTDKPSVIPQGQLHLYLFSKEEPLCIDMLVLPQITTEIPSATLDDSFLDSFSNLKLADYGCHKRDKVDVLLGAGACAKIFKGGKINLGDNLPTAFDTIFGWVLMGDFNCNIASSSGLPVFTCVTDLDATLKRFWEIEEVASSKVIDPNDLACENHFKETHTRTPQGRFVVRLPFKQGDHHLGETKNLAFHRLQSLERKLKRDVTLANKYGEFMRDYETSGHMQPVDTSTAQHFPNFYIPHHGVYKKDSDKIRCVFDASMKSSTGKSLNDVLLAGPKLQKDIVDIILHFRLHEVVFTADIRQMFRQVLVHHDDRKYQLIIWHDDQGNYTDFQLNTVTYGVTSSPYLAMRCVHELAYQGKHTHPRASKVLLNNIFVDDIVTGASSLEEAKEIKAEVIDLLSQGCFELRKWTSNCQELLDDMPTEHCELKFTEQGDHAALKILGLQYNPVSDMFTYQVSLESADCTKRSILSKISSIYDPNGWLAPCVIFVKILMQRLWKLGLQWDEVPPEPIVQEWKQFCLNIEYLENVSIQRQIVSNSVVYFDLHGFSDASDSAYAACVYLRCVHTDGRVTIHLVMSKTRVAPIKQNLTIPKLELSGAHLLARLLKRVTDTLKLNTDLHRHTFAWSDSSIVLCWIRTEPHLLKVFESHRVSDIQNTISPEFWRYVPTSMNPADPASRGITPQELVHHDLWWGPAWLLGSEATWPAPCEQLNHGSLPGLKPPKRVTAAVTNSDYNEDFIHKYSSLSRLISTTAWCLRFAFNCKNKEAIRNGPLTSEELEHSLLKLVKIVQQNAFKNDIQLLQKDKYCSTGLRRLHPFLDKEGMLRVGGRLVNSTLTYSVKHPLVLPHAHHLTNLLVDSYHLKYLHAGPNLLMSIIREKFWILSARRVIRSRIFKCLRCFRLKCQPPETLMGNLPTSRVTESCRPFVSVAVDFTGHFNLKTSPLRNAKIIKCYLCVFVCFTTKAVHLEIVSDLSAEAFLAALRRFVARRGLPKEITSDSGTNFKGACRILKDFSKIISNDPNLNSYLSDHFIQWKFSPPLSPHFNGLVEAAVKSSKNHLKRVIGDRNMTYEELVTIFTQIESILNSRPLCPMSNDPSDLSVLTPGHFIIGAPLVSVPETPIDYRMTLLSRWHLVQSIVSDVWKRWSHEYLHTLQQRHKWNTNTFDIKINDLVLVKEDNIPPLQWQMARVVNVFPGKDSVIRVVEIKTVKGNFTRSLSKLCPLPITN